MQKPGEVDSLAPPWAFQVLRTMTDVARGPIRRVRAAMLAACDGTEPAALPQALDLEDFGKAFRKLELAQNDLHIARGRLFRAVQTLPDNQSDSQFRLDQFSARIQADVGRLELFLELLSGVELLPADRALLERGSRSIAARMETYGLDAEASDETDATRLATELERVWGQGIPLEEAGEQERERWR